MKKKIERYRGNEKIGSGGGGGKGRGDDDDEEEEERRRNKMHEDRIVKP